MLVVYIALIGRTLLSSIVYGKAYLFYIRALSLGDASSVAPFYNLSLLFLLLFTALFLKEKLSITKISGILCPFIWGITLLLPFTFGYIYTY